MDFNDLGVLAPVLQKKPGLLFFRPKTSKSLIVLTPGKVSQARQ